MFRAGFLASLGDWSAFAQALIYGFLAIFAVLQVKWLKKSRSTAVDQLRATERATTAAVFVELHKKLNTEEARGIRGRVFRSGAVGKIDRDAALEFISQMEFLGFLAESNLLGANDIFEMYYGALIRGWDQLEGFIKAERGLRTSEYARHFERIHKQVVPWANERGLKAPAYLPPPPGGGRKRPTTKPQRARSRTR